MQRPRRDPARKDTHAPLASHPLAEEAVEAYLAGLAAVEPTPLVRRAVRQGLLDDWLFAGGARRDRPNRIQVLALGKAAPRMLWGLVEAGVDFAGIGCAPRGVPAPNVDTFTWLPGDHPVPGEASFAAGRAIQAWARGLARDARVLVLLSGGASACAEVPRAGLSEAELVAEWHRLLRAGLPVEALNRERAALSALKAGGLAREILARTLHVRTWLLQDTDPAHPEAVGSGPLWTGDGAIPHHTLAANTEFVAAVGLRLASLGWSVHRHAERVAGECAAEVERFLGALDATAGERVALVGGGEPTVCLPEGAPPGGRAQHAAVAAAVALRRRGQDGTLFAALASDGVDGATDAAGAWTLGADGSAAAEAALAGHATHAFLEARGRLVRTGPTGTNVNDAWIALRP